MDLTCYAGFNIYLSIHKSQLKASGRTGRARSGVSYLLLENNPRGKSRFTCSSGSGISHSRAVFCYLHRLESPVSQGRINAEEEEYVTGDRQVRVRTATQSSVTSAQVSERQRVPFCIFTFRKVKYSVCTLKTFFIIVALITLTACNSVQVLFGLLLFLLMNTTALRKVFFFFSVKTPFFMKETPWI